MEIVSKIKNTCKFTALVSFTIGTILVALFAISRSHDAIIIIGFYYIGIAGILNLVLFVSVFLSAFYFWEDRADLFAHCGLLLLNIPIALAYFFLVHNLASH